MNHFYENIFGWFNFHSLYEEEVARAKNGAHFVEVGAYLGKSTSFMAVEILNSKKEIQFDVVDTWLGSVDENRNYEEAIEKHGIVQEGNLYELFCKNMEPVKNVLQMVRNDSVIASTSYQDNSLDFVFIDASHAYTYVKKDIEAWYPKVKKGGVIAGHDYDKYWPGVCQAVDEIFKKNKLIVCQNCWLHIK